jgi:uncharacterized protein (TIGR03067 family)
MRRVLPHYAVLSLAFAPAPFPRPGLSKADLEKMQGEWICISFLTEGRRHDLLAHPLTAKVQGDRMTFGSPDDTWRLTRDGGGIARHIDFHRVKPLGGIDLIRGVYRLDNDTLTICWCLRKEEKDRPTGFDPAQPNVWVHVYKRKKP